MRYKSEKHTLSVSLSRRCDISFTAEPRVLRKSSCWRTTTINRHISLTTIFLTNKNIILRWILLALWFIWKPQRRQRGRERGWQSIFKHCLCFIHPAVVGQQNRKVTINHIGKNKIQQGSFKALSLKGASRCLEIILFHNDRVNIGTNRSIRPDPRVSGDENVK